MSAVQVFSHEAPDDGAHQKLTLQTKEKLMNVTVKCFCSFTSVSVK